MSICDPRIPTYSHYPQGGSSCRKGSKGVIKDKGSQRAEPWSHKTSGLIRRHSRECELPSVFHRQEERPCEDSDRAGRQPSLEKKNAHSSLLIAGFLLLTWCENKRLLLSSGIFFAVVPAAK